MSLLGPLQSLGVGEPFLPQGEGSSEPIGSGRFLAPCWGCALSPPLGSRLSVASPAEGPFPLLCTPQPCAAPAVLTRRAPPPGQSADHWEMLHCPNPQPHPTPAPPASPWAAPPSAPQCLASRSLKPAACYGGWDWILLLLWVPIALRRRHRMVSAGWLPRLPLLTRVRSVTTAAPHTLWTVLTWPLGARRPILPVVTGRLCAQEGQCVQDL